MHYNLNWAFAPTTRSKTMQRLFTIEVRVDYKDESKQEIMKKALQQAARHIYASANLLKDHIKPMIVVYSHDYFSGHHDIPLLEDDIEAVGNSLLSDEMKDEGVSKEMLDALKGA
jgi:hypothetical protein